MAELSERLRLVDGEGTCVGDSLATSQLSGDIKMTQTNDEKEHGIKLICIAPSTYEAFWIFNPSEWPLPASKSIIQSCAAEFSTIRHAADRIGLICEHRMERCSQYLETLKDQWAQASWTLGDAGYLAEDPELHLVIEGFFSGLKTFLDLIVQLLSTEAIVGAEVRGFHKDGNLIGGRVMKVLHGNALKEFKGVADSLFDLITEHKQQWIDDVIATRDLLVHPVKGAHQVMYDLRLENRDGSLDIDVLPPSIRDLSIVEYAANQVRNVKQFATEFLLELRSKTAASSIAIS